MVEHSTLDLSSGSYPPTVEPAFTEIRQGLSRTFTMSCRVLRAHPSRVLRFEWRLGSRLLTAGQFDSQDETEYSVRSLSREGYGEYSCDIINEAGAGRCSFLVTPPGALGCHAPVAVWRPLCNVCMLSSVGHPLSPRSCRARI
ncbi:hypothetical protein AAFF_G00048620 [Aldrovandia affinis]|uniref:Ig-like domain-containing protein n=1 Tax=Aldrovandia affinis TaxID=143900 RepID=A0AAD7S1K2_9TELE|nr:hypothetical protein AAFF_G00048620 [Aldrovandia affinis]